MAGDSLTKSCTKCKLVLPLSAFCKHGTGLYPSCRDCNRAYKLANKDRIAAYRLARHKEERVVNKAWRNRNRETENAKARTKRAEASPEDRARLAEYQAEWRKKNPIKSAARSARWYQKFKDRDKPQKKAYRAANRDIYNDSNRRWRAKYPEKKQAADRLNKCRRRGAAGKFTAEDTTRIRLAQRDKCAACAIDLHGTGQLDHITPIANGGSNWPRNLQWLCADCNRAKWHKDPIDFMRSLGRLL